MKGTVGYGKNNENATICEKKVQKIHPTKFDKSDATQHQEICLVSFKYLLDLRGNSKHVKIVRDELVMVFPNIPPPLCIHRMVGYQTHEQRQASPSLYMCF